jgi:hypothetical protein
MQEQSRNALEGSLSFRSQRLGEPRAEPDVAPDPDAFGAELAGGEQSSMSHEFLFGPSRVAVDSHGSISTSRHWSQTCCDTLAHTLAPSYLGENRECRATTLRVTAQENPLWRNSSLDLSIDKLSDVPSVSSPVSRVTLRRQKSTRLRLVPNSTSVFRNKPKNP